MIWPVPASVVFRKRLGTALRGAARPYMSIALAAILPASQPSHLAGVALVQAPSIAYSRARARSKATIGTGNTLWSASGNSVAPSNGDRRSVDKTDLARATNRPGPGGPPSILHPGAAMFLPSSAARPAK